MTALMLGHEDCLVGGQEADMLAHSVTYCFNCHGHNICAWAAPGYPPQDRDYSQRAALPYFYTTFSDLTPADMVFSARCTMPVHAQLSDNICAVLQVLTFRGDNDWSQHVAETAAETGLSGTNGLFEVASKTYREKIRQSQMSMDEADYVSSSDDEGAPAQQSANGTQQIRSRNLR